MPANLTANLDHSIGVGIAPSRYEYYYVNKSLLGCWLGYTNYAGAKLSLGPRRLFLRRQYKLIF
jgi:hypothetical protein